MSNFHDGYLEQGMPLGATRKDATLAADNTILDCDNCAAYYLTSDSTTSTSRTFTLKSGQIFGHRVVLFFQSGSAKTCELLSTGNAKLTATWAPLQYDTLTLQWDGTYWLEVGRGNTGSGTSGYIAAGTVTEAMVETTTTAGLRVKRVAHGIFDATGGKAIGAHTLGATIPINSFVNGVWYKVDTTFTSATDAGTIALSIQAANDVISAVAISDGANPWDLTTLPVEGISKLETTSTWLITSAARALTATVAVEALTAGVLHVWVEYITYK